MRRPSEDRCLDICCGVCANLGHVEWHHGINDRICMGKGHLDLLVVVGCVKCSSNLLDQVEYWFQTLSRPFKKLSSGPWMVALKLV